MPSRRSARLQRFAKASGQVVGRTRIVPDAATCRSCLDELFDPASRFHLYPFVTCTDCGPRFTITQPVALRSRKYIDGGFRPLSDCAADYDNPANRRFHAETIACPVCGPRLSHPIEEIATALQSWTNRRPQGNWRVPSPVRRNQRVSGRSPAPPQASSGRNPLRSWSPTRHRLNISPLRARRSWRCSARSLARSC